MSAMALGWAGDIPAGAMRVYDAGERRILVAHIGDQFYALDAKCPHMGGDLSRGRLEGTALTCPVHGSRFDVRDGRVIAWVDKLPGILKGAVTAIKKPTPATTYPLHVLDNNLSVSLPV